MRFSRLQNVLDFSSGFFFIILSAFFVCTLSTAVVVHAETISRFPERIVSLVPSLTESLFSLGLKTKVVGITDFCDHISGAFEIPSVGTCLEPNIEYILVKRPDLVLCSPDQSALSKRLEGLGIRCVTIRQTALEDIPEAIYKIGKICGVEVAAASVAARFQSRLDAISAAVESLNKPTVLLSVGRDISNGRIDQVYIASHGTYHDSLLRTAGAENAWHDIGFTAYPVITYEGLIELNPDIIVDLVPDPQRQPGGIESLKNAWSALSALKAVKNGRVYLLTESYLSIPGPESAADAAERLAGIFHPDAFLSKH